MTRGVFVTGTDTGVGKTVVASAALRALAATGARTVGMKPVAAGIADGERHNADVDALNAAGNVVAPLATATPMRSRPPSRLTLVPRKAVSPSTCLSSWLPTKHWLRVQIGSSSKGRAARSHR